MLQVCRLRALLLILAVLMPDVALGQTVGDYRARLDTLLTLWHQALETESEARPRLDTITVGALRLFVWSRNREVVRDAARLAMGELRDYLGEDTALVTRLPIFIDSPGDPLPPTGLGGSRIHLRRELGADREHLAGLLVDRVGRDFGLLLEEELSRWLGGRVPLGPPSLSEARTSYIDLATSDSRAARRCHRGDIRACRDALALDDHADPITVWYAPEERRRLVARRSWNRDARTRARACAEQGSGESCLDLLRSLPARALWPLPVASHRLLLRIAIDHGDPGAYTPLVESETPTVAERLGDASGLPPDSLVALWRSSVMSARPKGSPLSISVALSGLAWALIFFFTATRSTRWRRG